MPHLMDACEQGARSLRSDGRDVASRIEDRPPAALPVAGLAGDGIGLLAHRC